MKFEAKQGELWEPGTQTVHHISGENQPNRWVPASQTAERQKRSQQSGALKRRPAHL